MSERTCSECGAPVVASGSWLDGSPRERYVPSTEDITDKARIEALAARTSWHFKRYFEEDGFSTPVYQTEHGNFEVFRDAVDAAL